MASPNESGEYRPQGLWKPHGIPVGLVLDRFTSNIFPWPGSEEALMASLGNTSELHYKKFGEGVYRASQAGESGYGDCRAIAETHLGYAKLIRLPGYFLWERTKFYNHGNALVKGGQHYWLYEGADPRLWGSSLARNIGNRAIDIFQELAQEVVETAGGRVFLNGNCNALTADSFEWIPIAGELGDAQVPFENTIMMLPAEEAAFFIAAIGDAARYQAYKPKLWETLGEQISRNIPIGWVPTPNTAS